MSQFSIEINKILHGLQKGDETLFETLIAKTYNHLKVVAFKYTKNKNEIRDVVNSTYERTLQYIHSFNIFKNGYSWMCKILQNVAYDLDTQSGVLYYAENDGEIFSNYYDAMDDKYALMQELARLNSEEQAMIYLRFWRDLTYREIAKELNMSKTTVHRRILEIIEFLRIRLQ